MTQHEPSYPTPSYGSQAFKRIRTFIVQKDLDPHLTMITGLGATGKSYFSKRLKELWSPERTSILEFDSFILPRSNRRELGISGIDFAAYDVPGFASVLKRVISGAKTEIPFYDHRDGTSCPFCKDPKHQHIVSAADRIICVGAPTHHPLLRDIEPDLSIFFEFKDTDVARQLRVKRDVEERGRSELEANTEFDALLCDYRKFLLPSRATADIIVSIHSRHEAFIQQPELGQCGSN